MKFSPNPIKIEEKANVSQMTNLALTEIFSDPHNEILYDPREAEDEALYESVKRQGILQPLLLRAHPTLPGKFTIIAGHRRFKAAKRAGLKEVPVIVYTAKGTSQDALEQQLQFIETNALTRQQKVKENLDMILWLEQIYSMLRKSDKSLKGIPTRQLIAQSMGMSERQIADYMIVKNGLDEEGKKFWDAGELSLKAALSRIEKLKKAEDIAEEKKEEKKDSTTYPELMSLKNNKARKTYLDAYKKWKIYCRVSKINLVVRECQLPDGVRILSFDFGNGNEHKILLNSGEEVTAKKTQDKEIIRCLEEAREKLMKEVQDD
jgi:ParB/RepB/Spo0J family partition protein